MATITFDTLEFTQRLREAGFDDKQAEAVVKVLANAQSGMVTREHFDSRMETLELRMAALELRMTLKFGAMLAAATGVIIAVLRLPH